MLEAQLLGIDNGAALLLGLYVIGAIAWLIKGDY